MGSKLPFVNNGSNLYQALLVTGSLEISIVNYTTPDAKTLTAFWNTTANIISANSSSQTLNDTDF